jgi:hypothetical protein
MKEWEKRNTLSAYTPSTLPADFPKLSGFRYGAQLALSPPVASCAPLVDLIV